MKQLKNTSAFLLIAALVFTNVQCKKDKDEDKKELLTSGAWHVTAHTSNPGADWNDDGVDETDLYSVYAACEKDNTV